MFRSPVGRLLLGVAGLCVFYFLGVALRQLCGSCVDIRNASTETVRDVSVKVESGGKIYDVPNLAPRDHRRIYVRPQAKSQITLKITDGTNRPRDIMVFDGAQPGDCGVSMVTIQPGHSTVSEEFHHPVCWKSWLEFM
jgi:hypothetical protein